MQISSIPVETWSDVATGKLHPKFEFLALQILLSRIKLKIQFDPSPETVRQCVDELKDLFVRFGNLPAMERDLQKIIDSRRLL